MDAEAAGSEIECPSCSELIVIPSPEEAKSTSEAAPTATHQKLEEGEDTGHSGAIASSAAAKEIVHFSVPQHDEPAEILVKNTAKPLEVAAKESDKKIRVKTIRHTDCIEVGHDRYDEMVSEFLQRVGKDNIISINAINYTHIDMASKQLMTEYGVSIVYNG